MKAVLKAATLAGLIAMSGTSAFAQDSSEKEASTTAAAGDDAATSTTGATSGTTILNKDATTATTQSTASLPSAIQAAQPRKIFGELYSETYIPMNDFERGRGEAVLNSYGGVKFDLGNSNSLSLRQYFDYTSAKGENNANFKVQDTVLNFTRAKLVEFKNGGRLTLIARAYLPTGENSRDVNQNGRERLYLIGSKSLGKFDFTYVLLGQLWQQSYDYVESGPGKFRALNKASLTNEIDVFYNINSKLALGMIVGMDNIARGRAPGASTSYDDVYFQPTVQVSPIKGLTLQALLYNELNIRSPSTEHRLFRGSETQVAFNAAASL